MVFGQGAAGGFRVAAFAAACRTLALRGLRGRLRRILCLGHRLLGKVQAHHLILLGFVVTTVAALLPAFRASRIPPIAALRDIAPEADLDEVDAEEPLRDELDLYSMDLLSLYTKLSDALGVDIPEQDYPQITTLEGMVAYLAR